MGIISPVEAIFRRSTGGISKKIDEEWGMRAAKMSRSGFSEVPNMQIKEKAIKRVAKWFPFVFLPFILFVAFSLITDTTSLSYRTVYGENGVWDVRDFDFENYNVRFGGYVPFISDALLTPDEFDARANEAVSAHTRGDTHLTSRLRILVPEDVWFSFSRPSLDYSHRLYVNGDFLLEIGRPGYNRNEDIPNTGRIIFTAQAVDGVIEIVQQSTNFVHRQGGMHHDWYMGSGVALSDEARSADFRTSILIGSFFVLSVILFLVYFMLKGNHGTLYAALFSLIWLVRMGVTDGRVFTLLMPWLSWQMKFRLEYVSIPIAAAMIWAIINTLFPEILNKTVAKVIYAISAGFALFYLIADTVLMSHAILVSFAIYGAAIIYILFRLITKARKINIGQGIFLVGVVLFFVSSVVDVFYFTFDDMFISPPFQLTGVAMLLFTLCQATAVFMTTMHEVENSKHADQRLEIAEESNRAKGNFLAKMSHEIRMPLNAIIGMTELILRKDLPGETRDQAVTIRHSGDHLLSIINDILDFSKIESGKMEIINSEYPFHSTISDVISIVKMRITNPNLRFVIYVQHDIPNQLFGDEVRLRQVLLNVLANALKYTNSGYFSLDITGKKTKQNTVMLTIKIKDTGIGIKPEDMEKLFGEFTQFDLEKNKNVEGSGLGLAITKNLVTLMGGRIQMTSEYGVGSELTITLPQETCETSPESDFCDFSHFENKNALIYGKTPIYTEYTARSLKDLGMGCYVISNDNELLEKLSTGKWDYIFAEDDLVYSCFNAAKHITPDTKVVMITDSVETKCEKAHFVLVTPVYFVPIVNVITGRDMILSEESKHFEYFTAPDARILIVDDAEVNLMVAEGLLEPYCAGVDLCLSGQDAIKAVQTVDYDLVLMDHIMPKMDGIEAVKIIREMDGHFSDLPIIALTANALMGAKDVYLQSGFNDYLSKPIDIEKLHDIMTKWIPSEKQITVIKE